MESIISYFSGIGFDLLGMLKIGGILLIGCLLVSSLARFIFGKKSLLGHSVSSSIAIIFIYILVVLILTQASQYSFLVAPLPFAEISADQMQFFSFHDTDYCTIAGQLLSMVILAFLVNLMDCWFPRGKHILGWLFWRCATVAAGFLLHFAAVWLLNRYLPQGIQMYAPIVLIALLLLMLLTGSLRFLVGLLLTSVNPLVAALYTFFFASLVGKQITKAVFTTAILSGLILMLENFGVTAISLAAAALAAYIPFILILILVWYLVNLIL